MFSGRLPGDLSPNPLTRLLAQRRGPLLDLTQSNPTRCGLSYPESLLAPLADPGGLRYEPDPCGLLAAREAVAEHYRRSGAAVDPGRVVLTASTSEAYALLFKLLADPGDAVLVPRPSYPLLERLAALEGLRPVPYPLDPGDRWQPWPELASSEGARVCIIVNPNNPTGSYLDADARERLPTFCAEHDLALIADEVFLDYPLAEAADTRSLAADARCTSFALGGLSKQVGLPQLKLGWIVVAGPPERAAGTVERLAFIADHYLSVSTPVQRALPRLLREGAVVRDAIGARCRRNLERLERETQRVAALTVEPPGGGWSAVLRFPGTIEEERLALELLRDDDVLVHPGYFFDLPRPGHLVVSLLPEPDRFALGMRRVVDRIAAEL